MAAYIVRRLLQAIPVLFLISLISFWLMEQAPRSICAT
jgi:ABC-type dipeptide/oligopeptide/nickel transport system permease component